MRVADFNGMPLQPKIKKALSKVLRYKVTLLESVLKRKLRYIVENILPDEQKRFLIGFLSNVRPRGDYGVPVYQSEMLYNKTIELEYIKEIYNENRSYFSAELEQIQDVSNFIRNNFLSI